MLTLLLSTLGLGGAGLALRLFAPALFGTIAKVFAAIPPKVWLVLAALALLGGAYWYHRSTMADAYEAGKVAGAAARDAKWQASFDRMEAAADQWRTNFEQSTSTITERIRDENAAELRRIGARADGLRLRGPGQATAPACAVREGAARLPSPTGGPQPTGQPVANGMAGLPDEEPLALVPWPDLVQRSEAADADAAEVKAWRTWYAKQKDAWEAARKRLVDALPEPEFGQ